MYCCLKLDTLEFLTGGRISVIQLSKLLLFLESLINTNFLSCVCLVFSLTYRSQNAELLQQKQVIIYCSKYSAIWHNLHVAADFGELL